MSEIIAADHLSGPETTVVFGGSGFIGTHLLARLRSLYGGPIVCIDIRKPKTPVDGVEYRLGDVRHLEGLDLGVPVPRIFNLAAVHTTPGHEPWEYYDTNVNGAIGVTRFARAHQTRQIIFTSSISVYGPDEALKSESSPVNPVSDYGRSKYLAEKVHLDWMQEDSGRQLVISRPAVVFGHGEGGNFTRLARMLEKGWFAFPGRRDTIKSCVYVGDLVSWLLVASRQQQRQVLFNGAFADRYTIEDIVNAFKGVAYPHARTVTVPSYLLLFAAAILRPFSKAGLGVHPSRIEKLMVSTNIVSEWAEQSGIDARGRLERSLREWQQQGEGRFQ